jgi:hypothetical protein
LIGLLAAPAQAAWLVELTTGETLTVESYWRDGDQTHLMRGGIDIIVDTNRIKSMTDGAPAPDLGLQSATASPGASESADRSEPIALPSAAPEPVETLGAYQERLAAMTVEELAVEQRQATNALLEAQAARFEAQYGGKPKGEVDALRKHFEEAQRRDWAAETKLKERTQP